MADTSRFKQINGLARHREQAAGKDLSQSAQACQTAEQRLQQLQDYVQEYRQKFQQVMASGLDARQLSDYQRFLGNLDMALEQQRETLYGKREVRDAHEHKWREAHAEVKALDNLVSKHQALVQKKRDQKEQKEQDDHAARNYQSR